MANVKIKDVPVAESVTGTDKIPMSNGSDTAVTATIDQIANYVDTQKVKEIRDMLEGLDELLSKYE